MTTTSWVETKCRQAVASSCSPVNVLMPVATIVRAFAASTVKLLTTLGSRTKTTRLFAETVVGVLVSSPCAQAHTKQTDTNNVRLLMKTRRRMAGPAMPLEFHRQQKLRVGTGLLEFLRHEFHRLHRRNPRQRLPQDVDALKLVGMIEQLLLARAAALDVDRREDAFLDKMTVQAQLHIACALELFKDDLIHARARFY